MFMNLIRIVFLTGFRLAPIFLARLPGTNLSYSGTTVAIGAPNNDGSFNDAGHVRVYSLAGSNWVQVGSDIEGEAAGDQSGWSVALSADGKTVAIGAVAHDGTGLDNGEVRFFHLLPVPVLGRRLVW
jgi:hypothetical protein